MEYGSMSIQQLQSGRWLNWGIRFFLTAALTASQTAGGYAPFALGCIAAAGPGADGAAALLGGVTGALLFLDFQQVLALAAVGILILTAATAFRDTAFLQKPWVLPVLAAGMVLAVGGIYVLQSLDPLSHAAPCAAASALTGVSAHFFTRLFEPEEDRLAPEGLLFLGAALTLALGDLTILNVSVGRVLLCALLAYTAYDQGPMTGVTAGLGLGLITDLSAGTSGLFTAAYGVAGLCAAKCRRRSIAALAFFSGAAVAMLTSREELALTLALGDLTILNVSVGRVLLCALLAYTAYDQGPMTGVTAGLGLGLITDLSAGTSGLFTAAYGVAGLCAAKCRRRSIAALAFFSGAAVAMLTSREELAQTLLLETVAGSLLFLALPRRIFGGKRLLRETAPDTTQRTALKTHLNRAAEALRELYDSMSRTPPPQEENPAVIFDRAAEKVCRGCALCELCWQKEYTATFNALNDATPYLLERGKAKAKDFPVHFADRCIHLSELLQAINGELSAFLLRKQYRRQLEETRRSAKGQYAQMSDLLTAAAAGLSGAAPAFGEIPACVIGAALRPKEGEMVCGDTMEAFRTDSGLWCLLLADGMGSGDAARRESSLTCRLLRQFLEADIQPEAALTTLNSAMALRGAETGSFTTVDLCVLKGSEATFYKFGAAPSYLKKNGAVRRITGSSLPVGLRGTPAAPDITTVTLEPGSFAVMISDGVADPSRDEWLQDLLAGWGGDDPQTLANLILSESIRRERLQDDCAVQVLYRLPESEQPV